MSTQVKFGYPKVGDVLNYGWEQLLLEQANIVFKYLMKIGASKEDAEDITQETIMKTIEYLGQIEAGKIRAWMFKVAIHRYYSLYKRQKSMVTITDEDMELFIPALEHVESSLLEKERAKLLTQCLQQLQPTFQQ